MCFTDMECEWYIGEQDYHAAECLEACKCYECRRQIVPGELLWSVWQEEDVELRYGYDEDDDNPEPPETFDVAICGACELTRFRIHLHELEEGCHVDESWCPFGGLYDYCCEADFERSTAEEGQAFLLWKMERKSVANG